ncbi:MAG: putative Ig domain-containing protein [Gammaproteobacteria bacterium]|nr:putative Ig domain-containing protein [Gammaproteobacteria bacterium]MCP5196722.1 putative Ig domain-containing protein [Gammaproteobacteria bacterium]
MRTLISRLRSLTEWFLLTMLLMVGGGMGAVLAQGFTNPGGGSGGFTGRPLITVEFYVNDVDTGEPVTSTRIPVNLAGVGPNPSLPYTRTLTAVVKQDGRLFPSSIQFDLAPTLASGALFDPEDLTQGFRSLPVESTSGLATAFFHAFETPGIVTITASAQDPNTGQVVSASIQIEVYNEERPPASITFTGPYVNAVLAGESRFGDPPIQDGTYSRVVSVVVNDANGNPTNPNTQIKFYVIDGPLTGYPNNPGEFFIAGSNGDPAEGQTQFRARNGNFKTKGVLPFDWLMLDGRLLSASGPNNIYHTSLRRVQQVVRPNVLAVQQSFKTGKNNRGTVPYIIGRAESAAILSPSFTSLTGVASTVLTYPVEKLGQTAVLMACTTDMNVCGFLNTCDASGANCKSVYLGVTNGSDRTLTVSTISLGPNRSTDVRMCLRDVNFTPLPATAIRYDVGARGPAVVTLTANGVTNANVRGSFLTGSDGCTTVAIASSGQIPGSQEIPIEFTSDNVATPAVVTIRSPGAGKMDGLFDCQVNPEEGTGACTGTLRLTDDEGSPIAGILIAVGDIQAAGRFTLTFDPAEGNFGKTDDQGEVQVTVSMERPGDYAFPFQTASGGTASFTLNVTVPEPGTLAIDLSATDAEVGVPFSAALSATGGVPPYEWSLSGSLPPGLGLDPKTGIISGTPTTEGTFSFVIQVKETRPDGDTSALTGSAAFTITVGAPQTEPLEVTLTGPTEGTVGIAYSAVLEATGGVDPYTFALAAGTLPSGVTLSSNGTLAGTPTAAGTFTFSVRATDSLGATGTGAFTLTIGSSGGGTGDPLTLALNTLPTATAGVPYSTVMGTASGGTAPYAWSFESRGNLPTDIALSSSGVLSGTFGAAGTYNFVVRVSDSSVPAQSSIANATVTVESAGGGGGGVTPTQLTLLTSSPDLPSSGQEPVTLTAIARDSGGVLLQDVTVTFQITSGDGAIQLVDGGVTDETGRATAILSTGGNQRNRDIVVTATSGSASANVTVTVSGTTLTISGVDPGASVLVGDTLKLILELADSSGTGIARETLNVTSVLNGLSLLTDVDSDALGSTLQVTTNSSGVAELNLKINQNGQDTITATWPGDAADPTTLQLTASSDKIVIKVVDATTNQADVIGISSVGNIEVTWTTLVNCADPNGCLVSPADITLVTTKGTLTVTNPGGNPLLGTIASSVPGGSTITATGKTTRNGQTVTVTSAPKSIQFVAQTPLPSKFVVQANPSTIPVNVPPATSSQSTITAIVRDANDNPVPGIQITFKVTKDTSGGVLNSAVATTDFSGQASVVYTAGSSATPENGVVIEATATTPVSLSATTALTVSKREVFITLGTGNTIVELNSTTYALPYSVLVNDIVGGAVQGAVVALDTVPSQYRKGQYFWNGVVWVPVVAVVCDNEDINSNGILDSGEDVNGNGRLDPGNVVTPSVASIVTDEDGFGDFDVLYAQQYANWINNVLTARTKVGGSEDVEVANFVLPALAADLAAETQSPPGQPSPFGVLPNCTVSAETENSLNLTAAPGAGVPSNPPQDLELSVGTLFTPAESASGTVTVVVNLSGFAGDLTGTSVIANTSSVVANVDISTSPVLTTTGSQVVFPVTVSNTSTTDSVPVSSAGITVGNITFAVGDAKTVMRVVLKQ